jgi:formate-dependent nitrite reductase membrane component NrfD
MEPIVLWQHKWGLSFHIPWYLFLGGLAGGTMTVGALADLLGGGRQGFRQFAKVAAYVTLPAIIVGGLALSFHLGKPERGFAFPLFFTNYQSWLTIGGAVVGTFAPLSVAYAAAWYFDFGRMVRLVLAAIAVPLGLLMSLYTGFLLSAAWVMPANRWYVPLWDRDYLPVLFVLSGFSTGLAACGLAVLLWGRLTRHFPRLGGGGDTAAVAEATSLADVAALLAEGVWVYLFLGALASGTLGQQMAFSLLTRGQLAPWFWWGFVATGLAVPMLASLIHLVAHRVFHVHARWILYAKFALVLAGGLVLRYTIVWGGDLKAPLVFPPSLFQVPTLPPLPGLGG